MAEGNANAEESKNNTPGSERYEKNKKYLQGSLVKFNDKIYLAKRNVPSDVDLDNPYYWEIFMDAADSKRVDELFEKTGNLDELETESKDNLVNAINEAVLYTAQSLTEEEQAQARANIGAGTPYTLLQATSETIGGVKADSAEAADTQPVRTRGDGKLYTEAGGTDISLGLTAASVGQTIKVKAVDESGKPTAWEAVDLPSGGGGASYRSWSKVWTLAVAEDIAGFEASNIDLDGKSEIMIVFISDSTASRTMVNGRLIINGVDAGKVLFNSLQLKKDSHSFVIIGRADDGIEYTTMAAKAEYQTYPWQGDVNVVHRMVRGTNAVIQWIAGSTIEITQASATLGQGVTIEIYVR